ncbi:antitoxin HicB [Corynebacterium hindlerae]|uniref:antitoxin HicB n=1 Tax=Corynebacterium hindlerae TaxID=699041 RepID=UPI001AD69D70|nr:antitoxin HicB [Corynebacterium hindlerae]QTH59823.1 antitoxin HicB [Corynebacterium hindlerae]
METNRIVVQASRWEGGWDLVIDDNNATSVSALKHAKQQVRDYLDTVEPEVDHSHVEILIRATLDGFENEIAEAKAQTEQAARLQEVAAARIRNVARQLKDRGISSADTAELLGVSTGRVYQLLS